VALYCDVAKALLRRERRRSRQRLENKIQRAARDIKEAEWKLEQLESKRRQLIDRYTRYLLGSARRRHHTHMVGLGISLSKDPEICSPHNKHWPKAASNTDEADGNMEQI
jgi:hypothetical protein